LILITAAIVAMIDRTHLQYLYEKEGLILLGIQEIHAVAMTSLGALTLLLVIARSFGQARRDLVAWRGATIDRTLELWIAGALIFNVACTPFNAVRHLLLAMIPLTLWVGRQHALPRIGLNISLVGSTLLGFALAVADYQIADVYRTLAQKQMRQDISRGERVWYTGNWGITYYGRKEGAQPLFAHTERYGLGKPMIGDRIYNPVTITWQPIHPTGLEWVEHLQPDGGWPLRTIAPGALYHGMKPLDLPWVFPLLSPAPKEGREGYQFPPLDHIRVWQVRQPIVEPVIEQSPTSSPGVLDAKP
jgi:hypothetical protein